MYNLDNQCLRAVLVELGLDRLDTPAGRRGALIFNIRPQIVDKGEADPNSTTTVLRPHQTAHARALWTNSTAIVGIIFGRIPRKAYLAFMMGLLVRVRGARQKLMARVLTR
jgi:hypothetical protein